MSTLPRRLRAVRRQLEITGLELLAAVLRRRPRPSWPPRLPWVAAAVAVVAVAVALTTVLLPRSTARSASAQRPADAGPALVADPTPPTGVLSPDAFAGAAKRPAASAPLQRLPQVDLNGLSVAGIPPAALAAYVTAARTTNRSDPGCHLRWWLLAGIGLVESDHARSGGSTSAKWNGIARPPIYGPRLDGSQGFAAIRDTDRGALDGDKKWDRAVGPMQFLPSTWRSWGGTGAHGRMRDPQDIRAAAVATAGYLCAGSADLSQLQGLATAVYSYNHSFDYVRLVLSVAARYAGISPDALGVNRLPRDKQPTKKHPKGAAANPSAKPSPSASGGGTSPSAAPSSGGSHPPTPSSSPSSGPSLPPLPTPTGPVGVVRR